MAFTIPRGFARPSPEAPAYSAEAPIPVRVVGKGYERARDKASIRGTIVSGGTARNYDLLQLLENTVIYINKIMVTLTTGAGPAQGCNYRLVLIHQEFNSVEEVIDAFNVSAVNQLKIYTLDREGVEALDVPASPLTGTFRTVRPFRGDQKVRGMSIDPTKPDILRAVFASGAAGDSVSDFLMDFEMERLPMSEQDA